MFSSSSFSAIFILSALHNYKLSFKNVWLFPICQLHLANYFTWLLCLILSFFSYALQQKSSRVASFLAPSALSVYLIHVHPLIWNHLMLYFAIGHFPSGPMLFVWVITAALCIYLVCTIIDLPRRLLWYIAARFYKAVLGSVLLSATTALKRSPSVTR